ncbi:MAG: DUF4864 domain-containing protein [Alphaproteobacteria bacterium]
MRCLRYLILVLGMLAFAGPASAEWSDSERASIQDVIRRQLEAFKRDDGVTAFSFAAPTIRRQFETADNFLAMVREGYRPVYRPKAVTFGRLILAAGAPIQEVLILGKDGVGYVAAYHMERQADGSWRIAGCVLARGRGEPT